jgi:multidrug efflux system membrane fusion protein
MRKFLSYGLALIIILLLGAWLATGTLIIPGRGPGNGEVAVLQALDGKAGGPASTALEGTGLVKPTRRFPSPNGRH